MATGCFVLDTTTLIQWHPQGICEIKDMWPITRSYNYHAMVIRDTHHFIHESLKEATNKQLGLCLYV